MFSFWSLFLNWSSYCMTWVQIDWWKYMKALLLSRFLLWIYDWLKSCKHWWYDLTWHICIHTHFSQPLLTSECCSKVCSDNLQHSVFLVYSSWFISFSWTAQLWIAPVPSHSFWALTVTRLHITLFHTKQSIIGINVLISIYMIR